LIRVEQSTGFKMRRQMLAWMGAGIAKVEPPRGDEIARGSDGAPAFPLPWATDEPSSSLASPRKCAPLLKLAASL
jgi:hypothetical protein